jgi:hypothetical protein
MNDETLKALIDSEESIEFELQEHFDDLGTAVDAEEVAFEAERIFHLWGGPPEGEESAMGNLFFVIAQKSALGAFEAVAQCLGVDATALRMAVERSYSEHGETRPATWDALRAAVELQDEWSARVWE